MIKIEQTKNGAVRVIEDGAISVILPFADVSKFSKEVQKFCAVAWKGESANDYSKRVSPVESDESRLEKVVTQLINSEANSRGYSDIVSACSYAGYENAFQNEAIQLGRWRSAVWEVFYSFMDDVKSGKKASPSREDLLSSMPKIAEFELK